jgi:hypothetical protein
LLARLFPGQVGIRLRFRSSKPATFMREAASELRPRVVLEFDRIPILSQGFF